MDIKKQLRPFTIIPENLYIHRDADRQLNTIIDEMGRPGYVLVARQMGKTNLLLSAKRRLEDENNLFLYVDLSNKFQDIRTCFRNVIDTALRAYPIKLPKEIIDRSKTNELPPHIEHEGELISLLNNIKGKLVVILDEIDALMNVSFSDDLFAQIRSIYFSRVNIPQFERLTYILSGVAEPSEIIKNKNISPFNIGEKIYLDDFHIEEFTQLVNAASLPLTDNVKERIFYWSSGNPRMTWDICSAVEDQILAGAFIDANSVDSIVHHLYLTTFDKAPIDHIRKLCEDNREIRRAVIDIKNGHLEKIDSNLKRKLYLAGMIGSDITKNTSLTLKNRVIEAALSQEWLNEIEKSIVGLLKLGGEYYDNADYEKCIDIYTDYLSETDTPEAVVYSRLATSYFHLRQYNEAQKYFQLVTETDTAYNEYAFYRDNIHYHLGLSKYYTSKFPECIDDFKQVISSADNSIYKYFSMLSLSGAYSQLDFEAYGDEIIDLCTKIITEVDDKKNAENRSLVTHAYVSLGKVYFTVKKDTQKASGYFKLASEIADIDTTPAVLVNLLIQNDDETSNSRIELVERIVNHIIEHRLSIKDDLSNPLSLSKTIFTEIFYQTFLLDKSLFEKLISYVQENIFSKSELIDQLYGLAIFTLQATRIEETVSLIQKIIPNPELADINDHRVAYTLKILIGITKAGEFPEYEELYFRSVEHNKEIQVSGLDVYAFMLRIAHVLANKHKEKAKHLIYLINQKRKDVDSDEIVNYVAIDFLEIQLLFSDRAYAALNLKISNLNNFINEYLNEDFKELYLKKDDLLTIKAHINELVESIRINSKGNKPVSRLVPKVGRNDVITVKYISGNIVTAKFKKLEEDIRKGLCKVEPD